MAVAAWMSRRPTSFAGQCPHGNHTHPPHLHKTMSRSCNPDSERLRGPSRANFRGPISSPYPGCRRWCQVCHQPKGVAYVVLSRPRCRLVCGAATIVHVVPPRRHLCGSENHASEPTDDMLGSIRVTHPEAARAVHHMVRVQVSSSLWCGRSLHFIFALPSPSPCRKHSRDYELQNRPIRYGEYNEKTRNVAQIWIGRFSSNFSFCGPRSRQTHETRIMFSGIMATAQLSSHPKLRQTRYWAWIGAHCTRGKSVPIRILHHLPLAGETAIG